MKALIKMFTVERQWKTFTAALVTTLECLLPSNLWSPLQDVCTVLFFRGGK